MSAKVRCSNFELLRIISMLMIVVSHYFAHSVPMSALPLGPTRFFSELMCIGKIGVVIFMLISGYFLSASKSGLKASRVLKLLLQVIFYSLGFYILFAAIGKADVTGDNTLISLTPISHKTYWFVTVYVLIYLFHPFINRFLDAMDRRECLRFILLSAVVLTIVRTVTMSDLYAGEAGAFLLYYAIGRYLRLYKKNFFAIRKNRIISLAISVAIIALSIIIFDQQGVYSFAGMEGPSNYFLVSNGSFFVLIIGVCIFCAIGYAKEFKNKFINFLASLTFGVYLIHDNPYVRTVLWTDIFHCAEYLTPKLLIPHMLGTVSAIFLACSAIELVRKITVEKIYDVFVSPRIDTLQTVLVSRFCGQKKLK